MFNQVFSSKTKEILKESGDKKSYDQKKWQFKFCDLI